MGRRTNTAKWSGTRWRIDVQKDGERRSFYSSTPGRTGQREANAKADAWLDDNITGTDRRVKDLFAQYVEEKKATTSRSNWYNIEQYGKNRILPTVGHKKISGVTENDYQKILNQMFTAGMSKKTISNVRATIMEFSKFCRRIKVSTLNPEFLTIPKGAPVKEKTILQQKDIQTLFSSSETVFRGKVIEDPLINAYRFQLLTGLRPGELIGLRWEDIWDNIVHIRRAVNFYGEETKGKNENAVRNFVLIPAARKVLQDQWTLTGAEGAEIFDIPHEQTYRKRLIAYCQHNGLPEISPYMLRHTFVSVVKQLPEGLIKPLVGHSEDMDTLGIYAHALSGDDDKAALEVGRIFDDILESAVKSAVKA